MDWATATVLIIVVSVGLPMLIPILKIWSKGQRRDAEGDAVVAGLEQQVVALQERVEALEAIVTDDRYRLSQEFDRLTEPERARAAD